MSNSMKVFKGFLNKKSHLVLKKQIGRLEQKQHNYQLIIYSNKTDRLLVSSEVDPFKNYDFKIVGRENLTEPIGFGYLITLEGGTFLKIKFKTSSQELFAPIDLGSQQKVICA